MADQDEAAVATEAAGGPENGQGPADEVQLGAEIPEVPQPGQPQLVDEETARAAAHDGLPETGEPTHRQANDALASMLSAEPPPLPTETFEMKDLAERMGVEAFVVQLRGLKEVEIVQCGERAVKPPTKQQKKLGLSNGGPDNARMKRLLVAQAMVNPDLTNAALLEKHGPTSEHVIQRWFLPGEIDQLSEAVNDMSGYGAGAVERAKA